jgi:cellulose synthase/poly-beta-1,6-N-acetylglucosamine synthase-like glycosyltransferase
MGIDWTEVGGVVVVGLYAAAALYLFLYGLHWYLLVGLFRRRRPAQAEAQRRRLDRWTKGREDEDWPVVTTQIPLYNEANVARRVIEAAARMEYPPGRHEVQVLDDSADQTCRIVDDTIRDLQRQGRDVKVIRRPSRQGYKAGALAHGLGSARGEVVAVFDADFVPPREFLRRAVPLLMDRPRNACLQGRWSHLNEPLSWLTRAQALAIDGHFAVEQGGRSWNGLFMNFNGTAGLWRRAAIEDPAVGGWTSDTITEDLDLSYRAQLAGWRIEYCMDLACPSELPETVSALKTQQYRWAKGTIQCARKLLPRIWRSRLPLATKLEATMHLTGYSISIWMLVLGTLCMPLSWINPWAHLGGWGYLVAVLMWFGLSGPPVGHSYSRRALGGGWSGLKLGPLLMVLGVGLCINTSIACLAGLLQNGGEFVRTPKAGGRRLRADRPARGQRFRWAPLGLFELLAAVYCGWSFVHFLTASENIVGAFLLIFSMGFFLVGIHSIPIGIRPLLRESGLAKAGATGPAEALPTKGTPVPVRRGGGGGPSRRDAPILKPAAAVMPVAGPVRGDE